MKYNGSIFSGGIGCGFEGRGGKERARFPQPAPN